MHVFDIKKEIKKMSIAGIQTHVPFNLKANGIGRTFFTVEKEGKNVSLLFRIHCTMLLKCALVGQSLLLRRKEKCYFAVENAMLLKKSGWWILVSRECYCWI
jgi:hypothetical protein